MELLFPEKKVDNFIITRPDNAQNISFNLSATFMAENKNYALSQVTLSQPDELPAVVVEHKIRRPNRSLEDPFVGDRDLIITEPDAIPVAVHQALRKKAIQVLRPYEDRIRFYAPETDIRSDRVPLVVTDDVALALEDSGYSVAGLKEDYIGMESHEPTKWQKEIVFETEKLKEKLIELMDEFRQFIYTISDEIYYDCDCDNPLVEVSVTPIRLFKMPIDELINSVPKEYEGRVAQMLVEIQNLANEIKAREGAILDDNLSRIQLPKDLGISVDDLFEQTLQSLGMSGHEYEEW